MKEHALLRGERMRRMIAREKFGQAVKLPEGAVTVSIGVASYPEDGDNLDALLDHADQALYSAKKHGRNQVTAVPSA